YMAGFNRVYYGSRAPLFIGIHFEDWNGGIYMNTSGTAAGNRGSTPARSTDDLPDPEAPRRTSSLFRSRCPTSRSVRSFRPKNMAASACWNGLRPT
ncbi:hypothetical protein AB0F45_35905, partial [Streptomyces achromogenes]|uniref:hypothetical protein n=1 Tax=Streptomyces achromogenes TaxID=67255 RepID=UPI0033E42F2F